MPNIIIATRGSQLALWQAHFVGDTLKKCYPGKITYELLVLKTKGDIILDVPLAKVGGKGLFVKEIEEALLDGRADIAVHSMKDVPMELPKGLVIGAIPERENPADMLLSMHYPSLTELPKGARIGTSSLRRQAQILAMRPDLVIESLRGNVNTRLRKLEEGLFDAIIMAAAGINRLSLKAPYMYSLSYPHFLPAAGQGAIGVEYAGARQDLHSLLLALHHLPTAICITAERAFLGGLQGGCQVPIAAFATLSGALPEACLPGNYLSGHPPKGVISCTLSLTGLVSSPDGKTVFREQVQGSPAAAAALGASLAETVKKAGAQAVLEDFYKGIE